MLKDDVKKWFESDRSFDTGRYLYLKNSNNLSFKTVLNRHGNTPGNYSMLCYELAKLAGIPEPLYKRMLCTPKTEVAEKTAEPVKVDINTIDPKVILEGIELYNINDLDWPKLVALYKESGLKGQRAKAGMIAQLTGLKDEKLVKTVPEEVKKAFRLRQEFPFLYSKDCPDTLKILVADMITAHDQYVADHKALVESLNESTIAALSQSVVENYLENRQIWDELQHYKEKKTVLGKHPVFDWIKRKEEIGKMPVPDLVKLKDQLENNIPRTAKKIQDEPDHAQTAQRQARLEQFKKELSEVKRLLNINE